MTKVPDFPIEDKPLYKIPLEGTKEGTRTDYKAIRKAELKLIEKQLIEAEKQRLGEEEYQHKLAMRLRNII